jgi:hypothetical protein
MIVSAEMQMMERIVMNSFKMLFRYSFGQNKDNCENRLLR